MCSFLRTYTKYTYGTATFTPGPNADFPAVVEVILVAKEITSWMGRN